MKIYNFFENLPENFRYSEYNYFGTVSSKLIVKGDLNLSYNNLQRLPESFKNITVLCNLNLSYNKLKTLPESFKNIKVSCDLNIQFNSNRDFNNKFGIHGIHTMSWVILRLELCRVYTINNVHVIKYRPYMFNKPIIKY